MMLTAMQINNHVYDTNSEAFLCYCFINVGSLVDRNLPNQLNSDLRIYSQRSSQSFAFHEITEHEVNACINNIKNYSSTLGLDGITHKFIKLGKVKLAPV